MNKADGKNGPARIPVPPPADGKPEQPGWAAGLKKLYDSIVDEPLPDSFDDLLKKLDGGKND